MSEQVEVAELPMCDLCIYGIPPLNIPSPQPARAVVDGATVLDSRWANMCEYHFKKYGVGLSTGRGQQLVVRK